MVDRRTIIDGELIDDDFVQAAAFYNSTALGSSKENEFKRLKALFDEREILDPLVFLFSQYRLKHTPPPPPIKCTCLSELEDDAYELGGPMSRQKRPPPCELHKKR